MEILYILFAGLMCFLIIANDTEKKSKESSHIRASQTTARLKQNALKKRIEQYVEDKAEATKKYKIESMCLQAGYKLSYGEFMILSVGCAVILPLIMLTITNNIYLSAGAIVIGYLIPGQIVSFRRNKRIKNLDKLIGSFIKLVVERYKSMQDFPKAIELTMDDFEQYPEFYTEIKQTVSDIKLNNPADALDGLARRTGNMYLKRLASYYRVASNIGTKEAREKLLVQAQIQYEENRQLASTLKSRTKDAVTNAYMLIAFTPIMIGYQALTNSSYVDFMMNTTTGKVGSAVICGVIALCIWVVNTKVGAPIE